MGQLIVAFFPFKWLWLKNNKIKNSIWWNQTEHLYLVLVRAFMLVKSLFFSDKPKGCVLL